MSDKVSIFQLRLLFSSHFPQVIQQLFQIEWEGSVFIVFEFHETSLASCYQRFSSYTAIVRQLVNAIEYLQSLNIVLVNLNPSNIFVVAKNSNLVVKITNFSRAIELEGNSTAMKGNLSKQFKEFVAPEITKNRTVFLSSDVFSLGCILFYMFSNGMNIFDIKFKSHGNILEAKKSAVSNYTDVLSADLIQKLTVYKEAERLSVEQIKAHPLFWNPQEITMFFIEVFKLIETLGSNNVFRTALYRNSNAVLGENEDWTVKIDETVWRDLQSIRMDYKARSGTESEAKGKKNIVSLIRVMRNIIVHAPTSAIANYMGTPEKFVDYWFSRFPGLLLHIYNAKNSINN